MFLWFENNSNLPNLFLLDWGAKRHVVQSIETFFCMQSLTESSYLVEVIQDHELVTQAKVHVCLCSVKQLNLFILL